ncbi:MAG: DJ-1/PfpI family protein [Clostridiaceae bacterium]|jgi:4-methyl-5(b-hydroxyethyl)-thiazole monophosphate biosynthesis|nr:DJ-1/PfpI family protein [Clostridiaceae bacterium]
MKTLMLISNGFEEIEAITTIDILRRCGVKVDVASITGSREINGARDIKMVTDTLIEDVDVNGYDALLLPGGLPNAHNLRDDKRVIRIVKEYDKAGKVLAAICAAPCILERAGVIKNKNVTSYPGCIDESAVNYKKVKAVRDGNIVTGCGVGGAIDFALLIAKSLGKVEEAEKVRKGILYDWPLE